MSEKERTQEINRLQKRHPKTRRVRCYHGADRYSVQFFDKQTGVLVADYDLDPVICRTRLKYFPDNGNGR